MFGVPHGPDQKGIRAWQPELAFGHGIDDLVANKCRYSTQKGIDSDVDTNLEKGKG